jgi:hypothetical protein
MERGSCVRLPERTATEGCVQLAQACDNEPGVKALPMEINLLLVVEEVR